MFLQWRSNHSNVRLMKLKLFIGAILVGMMATPAVAQQPLLEDGKAWSVYNYDQFTLEGLTQTYFLRGDTIVNGHKYLKSWVSGFEDYLSHGGDRHLLYREEDGKVYVYVCAKEKEYLVYDFTMKPGDSFVYEADHAINKYNDVYKLTLLSISEEEFLYPSPVKRKVWHYDLSVWYGDYETGDGEFSSYIETDVIEGIGDLFRTGIHTYPFNRVGASSFRCCHDGTGKVIYTPDEEGWCYRYTLGIDEVKDEAGELKVTESAGGRLAFAWNAGAGYRTLSLYSAEGRLVARQRPAAGETSAAFTGLPRGTYIYFFTADGQTKASGKVLVE